MLPPTGGPWELGEWAMAHGVDLFFGGHPLGTETTQQCRGTNSVNEPVVVRSGDVFSKGAGTVFVSVGGSGMHPIGTLPHHPEIPTSGGKAWFRKVVAGENGGTMYLGATYGVLSWSGEGRTLTLDLKSNGRALLDRLTINA